MIARDLLFADAHAHSNPVSGLGAREIAKRFSEKGGWFMALVSLPPWHYGLGRRGGFESYKKSIDIHLRECRVLREAGLKASCFAGFHPADVDKLESSGMPLDEVLVLAEKVIDYVGLLCREGVIDGIGEVGRQHYNTAPVRVAVAEIAMMKALEYSRDYDCLVHLHLENYGKATVHVVERITRLLGLKRREYVFFHHSSLKVMREALRLGFNATVPGKKNVLETFATSREEGEQPGFLVESDYIDDPRRPCVSQCPWEVVDNTLDLYRRGLLTLEDIFKVNVDNVVKAYRIEPP